MDSIAKRQIFFSRIKRKFLKNVWIPRFLLLILSASVLLAGIIFVKKVAEKTGITYYSGLTRDFLFPSKDKVKSWNNAVNIIILGKGGVGHEAPDLTDTIIFVSISLEKPKIILISLPRDIWIPELRAKLNSIYYWGNQKKGGGGLDLAKATVEEVLGIPVHYGCVIDFSGFQKIVDILGGINVNVRNSFTDLKYPIAGREDDLCNGDKEFKCRYEKIEFTGGMQKMDGETVLKFVRSRYSEGSEGTDLARVARQQDVIEALKNKLLSREVLFSPSKLLALKNAALELIETDISSTSGVVISRMTLMARESVRHYIMPIDLLENPEYLPKYDGLYVFIPRRLDPTNPNKRSWIDIHKWTQCALVGEDNCPLD